MGRSPSNHKEGLDLSINMDTQDTHGDSGLALLLLLLLRTAHKTKRITDTACMLQLFLPCYAIALEGEHLYTTPNTHRKACKHAKSSFGRASLSQVMVVRRAVARLLVSCCVL